jgi:hypothetical protein
MPAFTQEVHAGMFLSPNLVTPGPGRVMGELTPNMASWGGQSRLEKGGYPYLDKQC